MSTTAPCKVSIDAELYEQVKTKAKGEKPRRTIKSIVEEAFTAYVNGSGSAAPPPEDAILAMLDAKEAESQREVEEGDRASDPSRSARGRRGIQLTQQLRQAYMAAR